MQRTGIRTILALAALVAWSAPAFGQEQPSLAERAVSLALAGRCAEAIPLLRQASSESADKEAKRLTGKFGVRCAMLMNSQREATAFLSRLQEEFPDEIGVRASRRVRDRGSPAVIGILPLDRWLCVPVFRRVCPCHYKVQVSKRRACTSSE